MVSSTAKRSVAPPSIMVAGALPKSWKRSPGSGLSAPARPVSHRYEEVSRCEPPQGIDQEERPRKEDGDRDQTSYQRTNPRKEGSHPGYDTFVLADKREDEHQDQRDVANERPRRVGGEYRLVVLRPSGDHHQRDEGRVGDRSQGEDYSRTGEGEQSEATRGARLRRTRFRSPHPHDAPDQEPHPQYDIDTGRHQVLCGVMREQPAPVDALDSRTDQERERRTESDGAEDAEKTKGQDGANACASSQGPDGEQRPREVEAGQPEGEGGEEESGHPPMLPSSWAQPLGTALCPVRRPRQGASSPLHLRKPSIRRPGATIRRRRPPRAPGRGRSERPRRAGSAGLGKHGANTSR